MSDALSRGGRGLPGEGGKSEQRPDPAPEPKRARQAVPSRGQEQAAGVAAASAYVPPPSMREDISEEQERLVSLYSPGSPQAKRIDILRSQLLFPFHGEPPRTIMITSASPREGRSMLTANLAVSFARGLQQFVMAMDCHLMDPIVHELFKVPRHPGLTDFLEHGASVPEIIHRTGVDKLTVIPAGTPSQRSAEILATDKMAGLMQELRARYRDRYILLDTPPVQAFDDPAVLARLVEGIIFVVRAGSTDRELVLRALRGLPEEKIVGVVLNDVHGAVVDATAVGAADVEG
jgi:capsular exopolysaccharide synthesis family protein